MHHSITIAILAVLAALKARVGVYRTPRQEMMRTYAKFGWEIITFDPSTLGLAGGDGTTSSAAPAATSSPATAPAANISSAVDSTLATSTTTGVTGEVTATPETNESEYLELVTIGGQTLSLDFDTGSSDLWVFSNKLSSSQSSGHTSYDPSRSSTWSSYQGASWSIQYGDGSSASGSVGYDKVSIGGATFDKQCVELAEEVSGSFITDTNSDGLLGLSFGTINTVKPQKQKTFFENVMPSLAQPLFTADLKDNASGTYTFGEIDPSQYSGDIEWTSIDNSNGFWEFGSKSYSVNGKTYQCTTCNSVIADTGTSLIMVDDDIVKNYYGQIPSAKLSQQQGGYIYDCSAQLPPIGFQIGQGMATLTGEQITYAPLGDGTCFGGVQSNNGGDLQIFGDMLLKNFFAIFDGGNKTFGIAAKA
ncbi:hypothetical protein LTR86_001607 [Recurvomyces mirabilis]|nr:hypothetical protein LTR86_001607 [Recurvomyces mirabilis]